MARSYGVGQYRTGEAHQIVHDRMAVLNGTRRGVVFCHGATGSAHGWVGPSTAKQIRALSAAGYPIISADLSDPIYARSNWGNDDHIDAIGDARSYLEANFGAKADKVILFASSMGTAGALAYAKQNLSTVLVVAAQIPVLDVNAMYVSDAGGFRSDIETAYGITYPTAIPDIADHSPVAFGASDLLNLPVGLWTSTDDNIASDTSDAQAWINAGAAGADVTLTDIGAVGHTSTGATLPPEIVQYIDDHGGRA